MADLPGLHQLIHVAKSRPKIRTPTFCQGKPLQRLCQLLFTGNDIILSNHIITLQNMNLAFAGKLNTFQQQICGKL